MPGEVSPPFHVDYLAPAKRDIEEVLAQASTRGRFDNAVSLLRTIHDRLRTNPRRFGEESNRLPHLNIVIRHAVMRPISIYFGVHESRPYVWVKHVMLLSDW
jgi:hypothetical protein